MRNFICISGKAQHGKDSTATMLSNELKKYGKSVLVIHQADLLKFICKTYFNWNGEKDDFGRTLLQRVGTDVIRKEKPDFWVDFIEEVTSFFDETWDYILVPDTRFPNEVERLKTPTSKVTHVRVLRPNFTSPLTIEQQQHPSETSLDNAKYDYLIVNDGDLEALKQKVKILAINFTQGDSV